MKKHKEVANVIYKKQCKYVGSVAITQHGSEERQQFVNNKIAEMTEGVKGVPVMLMIFEEGVKVMKDDGSVVKMAHSIMRIMFSTSQPERKIFAYVGKTVNAGHRIVQAHMFKTKRSSHTKEMNVSLSKAFKLSYAKATVERKAKQHEFDVETPENRGTKIKGKRWAKQELAVGHKYNAHAEFATRKAQSVDESGRSMQDLNQVPDKNLTKQRSLEQLSENITNLDMHRHVPRTERPANCNNQEEKSYLRTVDEDLKNRRISSQQHSHVTQGEVLSLSTENTNVTGKSREFVSPAQRFSMVAESPTERFSTSESRFHGYVNIVDKKNEPLPPIPSGANVRESTFFEMTEEEILKDAEWYQLGYSREIAESILADRSIGSFFVRSSQTQVGAYVLTVKIPTSCKPNGIGNFLIEITNGTYSLKGFKPVFTSLTDLIAHYGSCREDIPVQLYLGFRNELMTKDDEDTAAEENEEEEYDDTDYQYYSTADDMIKELASL